MTSEVLINAGAGEIRVARLIDGRLEEYSFQRVLGEDAQSRVGDIILGRVQRVVPGMQAAFIEIGQPRAGFLALREARALAKNADDNTGISDCVREGEAILVQVIKYPIGDKGARLSAAPSLPGCMLVMTPGRPRVAVSRRIVDEAQRAQLIGLGEDLLKDSRLDPEAGFIFRTVAQGASPDALIQDALGLAEIWRGIDMQRRTARPPAMLYHDLGPIERTLRDLGHDLDDVSRILIDDAGAAQAARDYCRHALPGAEARIELVREDLFASRDLDESIAGLSQPRAELPSGGWITIETTEALTAIDVNSGSHANMSCLEETGLAVNLEAAREIGRQIRLRGIGGLIVADFIHMALAQNKERVLAALAESLAFDHVPVEISPMAEFGIVAITRKRVREPLARLASQACPSCDGDGRLPTAESVAQEILRRVENEARARPGHALVVTAAPSVADWFADNDTAVREALMRRGVGSVRFEAGALAREAFDVTAG